MYVCMYVCMYVMSCHVMSCRVMSCHAMPCHVMSCHVMSCHVMSCHVMYVCMYVCMYAPLSPPPASPGPPGSSTPPLGVGLAPSSCSPEADTTPKASQPGSPSAAGTPLGGCAPPLQPLLMEGPPMPSSPSGPKRLWPWLSFTTSAKRRRHSPPSSGGPAYMPAATGVSPDVWVAPSAPTPSPGHATLPAAQLGVALPAGSSSAWTRPPSLASAPAIQPVAGGTAAAVTTYLPPCCLLDPPPWPGGTGNPLPSHPLASAVAMFNGGSSGSSERPAFPSPMRQSMHGVEVIQPFPLPAAKRPRQ